MSSQIREQLGLLFMQLAWPLCLVKERACTGIASLLSRPEYREDGLEYLLSWLGVQGLESMAAVGLLTLVRARIVDPAIALPDVQVVQRALTHPSILSHMLLGEIYPDADLVLDESLRHSSDPPEDFASKPFFDEYRTRFVPEIYQYFAGRIEEKTGIPFVKHWAYEWQTVVGRLGMEPAYGPLNFWNTKTHRGEHRATSDTKMSEVFRSAYLRSLAWAMKTGILDEKAGRSLTTIACPVDLELWQLAPASRPAWWPEGRSVQTDLDTPVEAIWQQTTRLWEENRTADSRLARASGFLCEDKSVYHLEILGLFQVCDGPEEPDLSEIAAWYDNSNNQAATSCPDVLRCRGELLAPHIEAIAGRFGDWEVLPAAQYGRLAGNPPRWQPWRFSRPLWFPLPYLGKGKATFGFESNAVVTHSGETVLGQWFDWTDGLSDTEVWPLPPSTGEALFIPREVIEKFESETSSSFCWVCRLRVFYRKDEYEEYKEFADQKAIGASHVVRP